MLVPWSDKIPLPQSQQADVRGLLLRETSCPLASDGEALLDFRPNPAFFPFVPGTIRALRQPPLRRLEARSYEQISKQRPCRKRVPRIRTRGSKAGTGYGL